MEHQTSWNGNYKRSPSDFLQLTSCSTSTFSPTHKSVGKSFPVMNVSSRQSSGNEKAWYPYAFFILRGTKATTCPRRDQWMTKIWWMQIRTTGKKKMGKFLQRTRKRSKNSLATSREWPANIEKAEREPTRLRNIWIMEPNSERANSFGRRSVKKYAREKKLFWEPPGKTNLLTRETPVPTRLFIRSFSSCSIYVMFHRILSPWHRYRE